MRFNRTTAVLAVAGLGGFLLFAVAAPASAAQATHHITTLAYQADDFDCDGLTWQYSVSIQPGGLGADWHPDADSSATDGCAGVWTTVADSSGAQTHSGVVYGDDIWTFAYAHNGGGSTTIHAWVNFWNSDYLPGSSADPDCAAIRILPSRGSPFTIECPSYVVARARAMRVIQRHHLALAA